MFTACPLSPLGLDEFVQAQTRAEQALEPVPAEMAFDLSEHDAARSHIAASMLQRLREDAACYAEQANEGASVKLRGLLDRDLAAFVADPTHAGLAAGIERIERLIHKLQALADQDAAYAPRRPESLYTALSGFRHPPQ